MAKKKSGDYLQKVQLPLKGLSEQFAYGDQPAGTTAGAINVRSFEASTGRRRLSSRSGISKYASTQVNGNASIQDITSITIAKSSLTGPGNVMATGSNATLAQMLDQNQVTLYQQATSLGNAPVNVHMDTDGVGYAGAVNATRSMKLIRVEANGTLGWAANTTISGTGTWEIFGMDSNATQLFVYTANGSANGSIYRFYKNNGSLVDAGAWLQSPTQLKIPQVSTGVTLRPYKLIAITNGVLGIANNGSNLQQITLSTGVGVNNCTFGIGATTTTEALCADDSGNFYITGDSANASRDTLAKVNSSGVAVWQVNAVYTSLSYDLSGASLLAITSAGVLRDIDPSTGNTTRTSNSTLANPVSIAADGSNGCFVGGDNGYQRFGANRTILWTQNVTASSKVAVASTNTNTYSTSNRMSSTRSVIGLVTAGGTVATFSNSTLGTVTNGTVAMSSSASVVFSDVNGLYVYFVDGTQYKRFNTVNRAMESWTASNGSLPIDTLYETCRLICTWRGRTVLSGLRGDPQNWFMSAVDNPRNWDYAPSPTVATQAVAGNNAEAGLVGDLINCLIPYSDDLLIFGCDHSIWVMRGDPMAGGQIDRVSDTIGMAWGRPYCKDPTGAVYFFGSRGGVYRMAPGGAPERISQPIEERLADIDLSTTVVRMAWDDRQQGCHLFLTPTTSTTETTHYWFDQRSQAWWADQFGNTDHNPKSVYVFDGDTPSDRVVLLGSWDGYLRMLDTAATDDDGTDIDSYVYFGPMNGETGEVLHLKELKALMAETSGNVTWSVHTGSSEELAFAADATSNGTWTAGDNRFDLVMRAGQAIYVKASANTTWAMEMLMARIEELGATRRRIGE